MSDDPEYPEQDDEDKKKPQPPPKPQPQAIGSPIGASTGEAAPKSIGTPIVSPDQVQAAVATPPPNVQPQQQQMPLSIGSPVVPPPLTPRPQYHGLARVADTIAGATKIGSAIEAAGGLGTEGWRQKNADEEGQIAEGEKSRQANAQAELTGATAQATEQKPELAEQLGAMRQHLQDEKDQAAFDRTIEIIKGQNQRNTETVGGRESVAGTQAQSRENVADTGATSRENVAHTNAAARTAAAGQPHAQMMFVPDGHGGMVSMTVTPGTEVPAGAQTASGVNTMSTPTAQTRTRGEMAAVTEADEPKTFSMIDHIASKIGPGAGRWNQWWVNKAGANDPEFAALDSTLHAYASGLAVTHFGGRGGGQQYIAQMTKELGEAQSPEDLKARIRAWDGKMAQYAKAAGAQTPQNTGGTPAAGRGFAHWKASQGAH